MDGQTEAVAQEPYDELSTEFDIIEQRLKDTRRRIVTELYVNGGTASVTRLRNEDGAGVPRGTLSHHLPWLRGETDWWPDGFEALVEEVGREDRGYGNPVRIIGLTETGQRFAEWIVRENGGDIRADVERLDLVVDTHNNQIRSLLDRTDSIQDRVTEIRRLREQNAELEQRVEKVEEKFEIAREQIARIESDG